MAGPDTRTRRNLAKQGKAIPDPDGSGGRFPIRDETDARKAIRAVGRASGGEEGRRKVRRFIVKRLRALGLTDLIPSSWAPDGSLKS
ncbi:MAG: hypothetical protein ACRDTZ_00215 [Pseudonocardiaceae bacterium]